MKLLNCLISFVYFTCTFAHAEVLRAFPTASAIIGGITLPYSGDGQLNSQFEKEVLRKYDFDETWNSTVAGAIKVELVNVRSKLCGDRLGTETEFALKVFAKGDYDSELIALVKTTDANRKVREYLAYSTLPTPEQYAQLAAIPSNELSRRFVTNWIASDYLASSHAAVVDLAQRFLRARCDH